MADRRRPAEAEELAEPLGASFQASIDLVGCARVHMSLLPRETSLRNKHDRAHLAWSLVDSAHRIINHLKEQLGYHRDAEVLQLTGFATRCAQDASDAGASDSGAISALNSAAAAAISQARLRIRHTLFGPLELLLREAESRLPSDRLATTSEDLCVSVPEGFYPPRRAVRGPEVSVLDPAFTQTANRDMGSNPAFDGTEAGETLRYFWTLAARESMAAELAGLNAFEYDNFPLEYYLDFAKQAWDEARHSLFYMEMLPSVYAVMREQIHPDSDEGIAAARYFESGEGLPIPYEGTCYPSVWQATLGERLVLMNIRTEGPSIPGKRKRMEARLCSILRDLRVGIAIDACEEKNHANYGAKWLRYMYPEPEVYTAQVEQADLLRGFLMALTLAARENGSVSSVLARLSS